MICVVVGDKEWLAESGYVSPSLICRKCFYDYRRIFPIVDCPHFPDDTNGFFVKWNERLKRLETTEMSIREFPPHFPGHVRSVGMCEPIFCRRDECTYAHGQEERNQWNRALRSRVANSGT